MLVSVIIPCFNSEKFIHRCIDSVLQQKYESLELIFVDDGSTDSTQKILEKYTSENSAWIKYIKQKNSGACAARNAGLKIANGKYIQFLDADDSLLPEKILHQVSLAKKNNFPDIIAGSYTRYSSTKKEIINVFEDDSWVALIKGRLGSTCSNLFSKNALQKAGGWNEEFKSSQESELMFRLLKNGTTVVTDNNSLTEVFSQPANSISFKAPLENQIRFYELRTKIFDYLNEKNILNDERKKALAVILLGTIRMIYKGDQNKSRQFYFQEFKKHFHPVSGGGISKIYVLMLSIFGFNFSQKIFSAIGK